MTDASSEFMRLILLFTGNLRPKDQNLALKFKNHFFSISYIMFPALSFYCIFLQECSWKEKIECVQYLTSGIHIAGKHFNMIFNREKMFKLMDDVNRLWNEAKTVLPEKSLNVSIKTTKIMKGVVFFYLSYSIATIMKLIITTIMADGEPENKYLLRLWVPDDDYYWTNLITQCVVVTLTLACIASEISLVFYIAEKFDFQLEALSTMIETSETRQESSRAYRFHAENLKLLNDINKLFSGQYALEIIISSVQIAMRIYTTINAIREGSSDTVISILVVLMTLVAPFSLCYLGNCIYTKGESLQRSIFFSQWYKKKSSERKSFIIAQTMANKPLTINYRYCIFFSYEEYLKLLQASYSYVMLTFTLVN